jgi:hypothetical protein
MLWKVRPTDKSLRNSAPDRPTKDELNIALESTRTIEIDEFVPRKEIDDLYLGRPYTSCRMERLGTMGML